MKIIEIAQAGPMADALPLSAIVVNAVKSLLMVVGTLAILMLVIGGIMYMTAGGEKGRVDMAKNTIIGAVIGLVIAILSLVVVTAVTALV